MSEIPTEGSLGPRPPIEGADLPTPSALVRLEDIGVRYAEGPADEIVTSAFTTRLKTRLLLSDTVASMIDHMPDGLIRPLIQSAATSMHEQGIPRVASFNTINKCNLHCAGCYWGQTERRAEKEEVLSEKHGKSMINDLWVEGVREFMFIGGEPLMPESVDNVKAWTRRVAELGGFSTIVTNGTYGLPDPGELPRTHYFVSFDGGKAGMDRVRGKDHAHGGHPAYDVVRKMLAERAERTQVPQTDVMLAMTINGLNFDTLDEFMTNALEWEIGGVTFGFTTPQLTEKKSDGTYSKMYLQGEDRNKVVRKLLEIKDRYGNFVAMSRRSLELYDLDEVAKWSPDCPAVNSLSFDSAGKQIERCIFGPDGDCSNCACPIAVAGVAMQEGDKDTVLSMTGPIRSAQRAAKAALKATATL